MEARHTTTVRDGIEFLVIDRYIREKGRIYGFSINKEELEKAQQRGVRHFLLIFPSGSELSRAISTVSLLTAQSSLPRYGGTHYRVPFKRIGYEQEITTQIPTRKASTTQKTNTSTRKATALEKNIAALRAAGITSFRIATDGTIQVG